jgi:F420-dependent oxidoreductase-like protein
MRVCLMIEGQEDVTWEQWLGLAGACEEHGLEGLFRSDHYGSVMGMPERGSLDAWSTLAALAARTSRIRLGTLVSPATFRHPSVLAKNVVTVDHVSAGRVELGLGAGWNEGEHRAYGFAMPPTATRIEILAEQLEIVHRSWTEEAFSFAGAHYRLEDLRALPKPLQRPHPTLLVGGSAGPRSLALAARFADEYNTVFASVDEARERKRILDEAAREAGRDPLRFSLMIGCVVGRDEGELEERLEQFRKISSQDAPPISGTVDRVVAQLREYEQVGVERVMLQHLVHEDVEMVSVLGDVASGLV